MGPKTPNSEKPPALRCPRCFNLDVVPSLPRGFWDEVMRGFGRVPKHCRACGKRFFTRAPGQVGDADQ